MRHNSVDMNKFEYHRYYANGEIKPLFRGVFHLISLLFVPFTLIPLIYYCNSLEEYIGVIIYKLSILSCLFVSSIYHLINWSTYAEKKIQMLDHACIYLITMCSWAPIGSFYLTNTTYIYVAPIIGITLFCIIAFINNKYKLICYFISFCIFLIYSPQFINELTILEISLICLTFFQYLTGLYIYNTKKLDLFPSMFGYHEIFHLLTIGAFITTYITNLSLVIRN